MNWKALFLVFALSLPAAAAVRRHPGPIRRREPVSLSREDQLNEIEGRLNAWDGRIDQLRNKSRRVSHSRLQRLNYLILDMEKEMEEARQEFRELKTASDRNWDEHKAHLETVLNSIGKSYQDDRAE